jgi:phosphoserine phosphatase RsbU/P
MNESAHEQLNVLNEEFLRCMPGIDPSKIEEFLQKAYAIGLSQTRKERLYLRHLMQHLPDRIYFKDMESRFITGNDAFIRYFGVNSEAEVVGKTDFDFFPRVFAEQKFADEQRIIRERLILRKDEHDEQVEGETAWSSTTKMPLVDEDGNVIGTFGLSRDITEAKVAEQKLMALAEDLRAKNEQIEADLEMARKLQTAFVPTSYPVFRWGHDMEHNALTFSHRYVPSEKLAGDFFQVIPISSTKAGVLICDVMGHGIRASLVTAILRGLVGELKLITPYPHVFLRKVNRSLCAVLAQLDITLFVTAFYGVIDLDRGFLHYANAGHPPPVLADRNRGEASFLSAVAESPEPALGLIDGFKYGYQSVAIHSLNSLFFYTDGILDAESPDGETFGHERFLNAFVGLKPSDRQGVLDKLLATVDAFTCGAKLKDDMCIIRVNVDTLVNE